MSMIRDEIRQLVVNAIERAQHEHALPAVAAPEVTVERPSNPAHGDYASAVALKMARAARMSPMEIAARLAERVAAHPAIEAVEVAPPGFLNVRLSVGWLQAQVEQILHAGSDFGRVELGGGKRVQIEFVSANPTGPLHVGTGRGAALGDSLARVLEHAGYVVEREYYVNDAGSRMEAFNQSVHARYAQALGQTAELPEDGYPGDYLKTLGAQLAERNGRAFLDLPRDEASARLGREAMAILIEQVQEDLKLMNVHFDHWFYEQTLFDQGRVEASLKTLRERGYVVEREGAVWFTSTQVGEERDNVLVRSNGLPTYFASDVAYHYDKLVERGFDLAIDIWGADHQGHVPRMKAVVGALGVDPARLTVLLYQLVNLLKDGKVMAMGKRTGAFVTLREVLDDVGADAVRFFLVGRSPDAMMDFDLDKAKAQSEENPVWWVQMAHARLANILRDPRAGDYANGDPSLLEHPRELALIRKMLELPEVVMDAASAMAPHPIPHYSLELAQAIHGFYQDCHVLGTQGDLPEARLKLVAAARIVLAATLDLIGVAAPDYMEPRSQADA